ARRGPASGSSATFRHCGKDVDAAEQRARTAVRDGGDLAWLPLAAVECTAENIGFGAADRFHGSPEVRRRRLVCDIPELSGQPAVLDAEELLPGGLEGVTLHLDRTRAV